MRRLHRDGGRRRLPFYRLRLTDFNRYGSDMIKTRLLFGVVILALAAMLLSAVFLSGPARWFSVSALALLNSFALGALWQQRASFRIKNRGPEDNEPARAVDFAFELLNATVNEMREGLLVIDSEMRVVASNRAARDLFSNVDESISSRRLTELTRNPAIYDAFLDGVRGIERAGVKVETHGRERRVFDLRVVPLGAANGGGAGGAVGVFFDVTRLGRLEIVRQEVVLMVL